MVAPEPLPDPSITEPDGSVTDIREAFPGVAPILAPIVKQGSTLVWHDVYNWTSSAFHALTDPWTAPASLTKQFVQSMIDASLSRATTAYSSFVSQLQIWTAQSFNAAADLANAIEDYFLSETAFLQSEIDDIFHLIENLGNIDLSSIINELLRLQAQVDQLPGLVMGLAEQWALDNIYKPLTDELGAQVANLSNLIDVKSLLAAAAAEAFTLGQTAPIISELFHLQAQVNALQAQADDCVTPLCDEIGPNSPNWQRLKDLLKGLNAGELAALLALLAILATLTESDLETLAAQITALATGSAEQFVTQFFTGGATLGGALLGTVESAVGG